VRDHANYHNAQCFSPDGKYICFTRYEAYRSEPRRLLIYDLHLGREIEIAEIAGGVGPRWANNHNWLFFGRKGGEVMWLDVDTGELTSIGTGLTKQLGGTDCNDQWLFGGGRGPGGRQGMQGYRLAIRANSTPEILEGLIGIQWIPNPVHPVVFVRFDHYDEPQGDDYYLTKGTRYWFDLDGKNVRIGSPQISRCHQSWLGNGEYHLHSGNPMAGRRWDEPFPSNLHFLANVGCSDISPCGRSGRWISGSGNYHALQVADRRSGDGRNYLDAALSLLHTSDNVSGYAASSALHDCDAKGSPDGTKIVFVSNYDLKNGPVGRITDAVTEDRIVVDSTEGFPDQGSLSTAPDEVISYRRKTATSFEGLTRRRFLTRGFGTQGYAKLREGTIVTSFEARCIPEDLRQNITIPERFAADTFPDKGSPLVWQRRTDIYAAVVRLPDQPQLRKQGRHVELIPGENHWETVGYHLYLDGRRTTKTPVRPGTMSALTAKGKYTAVAVEWSGLQSEHSLPLEVSEINSTLVIREDKPEDFSWTTDRWLANGKSILEESALGLAEAVKETVHLVDGVIQRQWYANGQLAQQHDLNAHGQATRRLSFQNGTLARRDYFVGDDNLVSTELFDPSGYIVESTVYRDSMEKYHILSASAEIVFSEFPVAIKLRSSGLRRSPFFSMEA